MSGYQNKGGFGGQERKGPGGGRPQGPPAYQIRAQASTGTAQQAIDAINQHADKGVAKPSNRTRELVKNREGLRKTFAAPPKNQQLREIATNFLTLTPPSRIYVYAVDMYRDLTNPNRPEVVSRRADKEVLMDLITGPMCPQLGNNTTDWVSDGDLIWSTQELWGNANPPAQHTNMAQLNYNPVTMDLTYNNECGVSLTVERIDICFDQLIAWPQAMGPFLDIPAGVTIRRSTPSILLRGLNAMLTKHARLNGGTGGNPLTFKGGNKFFDNATQRPLGADARALDGFFLSARPGMKDLLLNVNTAHSPFYNRMTVQHFIANNASDNHGQLRAKLKGLKVSIRYRVAGGWNPPESQFRFIQNVDKDRNIGNTNCQDVNFQATRVRDWYLSPPAGAAHHPLAPANFTQYHNAASNAGTLVHNELAIKLAKDTRVNQIDWEWFPASMLDIVEFQPLKGDLNGQQTTQMIGYARLRPDLNAQEIMTNGLRMFSLQQGAQQAHLGQFAQNMSTGLQMLKVPGVFLQPPMVLYRQLNGNNVQQINPNGATWNLVDVRFATTHSLAGPKLPYVNIAGFNVDGTLIRMHDALVIHGLLPALVTTNTPLQQVPAAKLARWQSPPLDNTTSPNTHQIQHVTHTPAYETLVSICFSRVPAHLRSGSSTLTVLRRKDYPQYAYIKRVAELQIGMHTVMLSQDSLGRMNPGTALQAASNVALKYNLRSQTGVNHTLRAADFQPLAPPTGTTDRCIVIGADVTHPGAAATDGTPSIAAIVGSVDNHFMKFPGSMRLQRGGKEEIAELGDMVKERLIDWAEAHLVNGQPTLPARMLFYRDGVSESQYDKIRTYEIPQIQRAYNWAREYLDWKQTPAGQVAGAVVDPQRNPWPAATPVVPSPVPSEPNDDANFEYRDATGHNEQFSLTYVVVGKRHNTRFYPLQPQDTINNNGNVRPGLVVDQVITHPFSFDFYLQSHKPIAGTGRSAHYYVITNGMGLSTQDLQQVTHSFCYAYARATKGVSYCAPAYYADRLCERGRAYLHHWLKRREHMVPPNLHRSQQRNFYAYTRDRNSHHNPPESKLVYDRIVKNWLRDQAYYRFRALQQGAPKKYGFDRRNPWHENMDGTMFYL